MNELKNAELLMSQWRADANSRVVAIERSVVQRGEQLAVEELQSNPAFAHRVGGILSQVFIRIRSRCVCV